MRGLVAAAIGLLCACAAPTRTHVAVSSGPSYVPVTPRPAGFPTPAEQTAPLAIRMVPGYSARTIRSRSFTFVPHLGVNGYFLTRSANVALFASWVNFDTGAASPIVAIDMRNGRQLWKSRPVFTVSGDFVPAVVLGNTLYVNSSQQPFTSIVSILDGSTLGQRNGLSPLAARAGTVYLYGNATMTACDRALRRCNWKTSLNENMLFDPVFLGNRIVTSTVTGEHSVRLSGGYDIATGKRIWSRESDFPPFIGATADDIYIADTGIPSDDWYLPFTIDTISSRTGLLEQSYNYVPEPGYNAARWPNIANFNSCTSVVRQLPPAHVNGTFLYLCVGNVWYRYPAKAPPKTAMSLGSLQPFLWLDHNRMLVRFGSRIGTATMGATSVSVRPWIYGLRDDEEVVATVPLANGSRYVAVGKSVFALTAQGAPSLLGTLHCAPKRLIASQNYASAFCDMHGSNATASIQTLTIGV